MEAWTVTLPPINEQRTSENILNVMTADTIEELPNQSVATALGRMPGVTVQINEGEAQYVQIRGTEPRLSNTTVDGVDRARARSAGAAG